MTVTSSPAPASANAFDPALPSKTRDGREVAILGAAGGNGGSSLLIGRVQREIGERYWRSDDGRLYLFGGRDGPAALDLVNVPADPAPIAGGERGPFDDLIEERGACLKDVLEGTDPIDRDIASARVVEIDAELSKTWPMSKHAAPLPTKGEGDAVAWQWRLRGEDDDGWLTCVSRDEADAHIRLNGDRVVVRPLYAHPSPAPRDGGGKVDETQIILAWARVMDANITAPVDPCDGAQIKPLLRAALAAHPTLPQGDAGGEDDAAFVSPLKKIADEMRDGTARFVGPSCQVNGVGRDAEYPKCLIVYLSAPATDDELRVVHEAVRSALARKEARS